MSTDLSTSSSISRRQRFQSLLRFRNPVGLFVSVAVVVFVSLAIWNFWVRPYKARLNDQAKQIDALSASQSIEAQKLTQLKSAQAEQIASLLSEFRRDRESFQAIQDELKTVRNQASERRSEIAVSRVKVTRIRAQAASVKKQLEELTRELVSWQTKYTPLLDNDSGRKLAVNDVAREMAITALMRERPDDAMLQSWVQELGDLTSGLVENEAVTDHETVVTAEHAQLLADMEKEVRQVLESLRQDRLVLDALLKESESLAPAQDSLRQTVDQQRVAAAKRKAEQIQQHEKELADQELKQELELKTKESQQRVADQQRAIDEQNRLNQNLEAERRRQAQREREYQSVKADVRSLVSPFSASRMSLRGTHSGPGPASLTYLKGSGALEAKNYRQLWNLAADTERPVQGMASNALRDDQIQRIHRAQQYIITYGDLLVRDGMLAE